MAAVACSDVRWQKRDVAPIFVECGLEMREDAALSGHASRMEGPGHALGRALSVGIAAALALSAVGAMGTDIVPLLPRTGYWMIVMLTGAALGSGIGFAVRQWGRLAHRVLGQVLTIALLVAIPLTLVVCAAGMVILDQPEPTPDSLATLFGIVLAFSVVMTALTGNARSSRPPEPWGERHAMPAVPLPADREPHGVDAAAAPAGATADTSARPALMDRLPPRLATARLLALEAEDHYLRVHTDAGSALILMRLSDAIAETGCVEGARCHRSWWAARWAVESASRRGTAAALRLNGGLDVPVSRSHLPGLRAAGWM